MLQPWIFRRYRDRHLLLIRLLLIRLLVGQTLILWSELVLGTRALLLNLKLLPLELLLLDLLLLELLLHLLGRNLRLRLHRLPLRLLIACVLLDERSIIWLPHVLLGALLNRLLELPDWQLLLPTEHVRHFISVDLLRNRLLLLDAPVILALLRVHLLQLMQLHRMHDHMLLDVIRQIPKSLL